MCVYPLLWLLFSLNIHKWNTGYIICYSYDVTEKKSSLWYRSKSKSFSMFCAHPWEFSEPILHKTGDSLA
jgi:hypothetical protein